jgi:hypothetical protein
MPITPDIPKAEAAIVEQTNRFRLEEKLAPVKSEPLLTKAARDFARFLASSSRFSHEADGRRPVERIKAAGYQPCSVAENLAWHSDSRGFETLQLATMNVEGWKGSPGHRKNLLMEHATETGVAIVKARREEKYFAVQLFGRPASLQYSFRIENIAGREIAYTLGTQPERIPPRTAIAHTACTPAQVTFTLKPAGILSKAVTASYEAKDGTVFKLVAKGGEVAVEVAPPR